MATLLLVEDNDLNRDMLSRRLTRRGYDVLLAHDGQQGLEMVREHEPDLVLMDLHLPRLDGWEATRRIRSEPRIARTPVLALTADAMSGDREKALDAGCDDYETKPIDFARLLEKIERLLG